VTDTDAPPRGIATLTKGHADAQRRETETGAQLTAIQAKAAARTGWQPWMTEEAGWGGLGEGYAEWAEAQDDRRERYERCEQVHQEQEA
jgi:hypothetical protein